MHSPLYLLLTARITETTHIPQILKLLQAANTKACIGAARGTCVCGKLRQRLIVHLSSCKEWRACKSIDRKVLLDKNQFVECKYCKEIISRPKYSSHLSQHGETRGTVLFDCEDQTNDIGVLQTSACNHLYDKDGCTEGNQSAQILLSSTSTSTENQMIHAKLPIATTTSLIVPDGGLDVYADRKSCICGKFILLLLPHLKSCKFWRMASRSDRKIVLDRYGFAECVHCGVFISDTKFQSHLEEHNGSVDDEHVQSIHSSQNNSCNEMDIETDDCAQAEDLFDVDHNQCTTALNSYLKEEYPVCESKCDVWISFNSQNNQEIQDAHQHSFNNLSIDFAVIDEQEQLQHNISEEISRLNHARAVSVTRGTPILPNEYEGIVGQEELHRILSNEIVQARKFADNPDKQVTVDTCSTSIDCEYEIPYQDTIGVFNNVDILLGEYSGVIADVYQSSSSGFNDVDMLPGEYDGIVGQEHLQRLLSNEIMQLNRSICTPDLIPTVPAEITDGVNMQYLMKQLNATSNYPLSEDLLGLYTK